MKITILGILMATGFSLAGTYAFAGYGAGCPGELQPWWIICSNGLETGATGNNEKVILRYAKEYCSRYSNPPATVISVEAMACDG